MGGNHNYNIPEKGATEWHKPINKNFEQLDSEVEIRDEEGNLSQYTPKAGAKFFATDSECQFLGDGNKWNRLASTGKAPEFESIRTNKLNDSIHINNDVSDIGAATNEAIERLSPEGGTIVLPKGVHKITTTIDLSPSVSSQVRQTPITIRGQGMTKGTEYGGVGTTLDASELDSETILLGPEWNSFLTLRDFCVFNPPKNGTDCISLGSQDQGDESKLTFSTIENILVFRGGDWAFNIGDMYGSTVNKLYAIEANRGIKMYKMNASNVSNLAARVITGDPAMRVHGGYGSQFRNLYIESNYQRGFTTTGYLRACAFDGLYFENNNRSGDNNSVVHIGDGAANGVTEQVRFSGLRLSTPGKEILLDDTSSLTINATRLQGCDISGTSTFWGGCVFINNDMENVNFENANDGSTWIENNIRGTVSRPDSATVVSGD